MHIPFSHLTIRHCRVSDASPLYNPKRRFYINIMTLLTRESTKRSQAKGRAENHWVGTRELPEGRDFSVGRNHSQEFSWTPKVLPRWAILSRSHIGKGPLGFALEQFTRQGRWTSWHLGSITPRLTHGRAGTLSVDVTRQGLLTMQVAVEAAHSPQDHSWKCTRTLSSLIRQGTSGLRQHLLLWPVSHTVFFYVILSPLTSFADKTVKGQNIRDEADLSVVMTKGILQLLWAKAKGPISSARQDDALDRRHYQVPPLMRPTPHIQIRWPWVSSGAQDTEWLLIKQQSNTNSTSHWSHKATVDI